MSRCGFAPVCPRARAMRARSRAGFTLIEAALTTVIIGTGVLAIVAAQQAYHQKNDWAQRTATAQHLANELRELTMPLPMHDPVSGDNELGPGTEEDAVADYDDLDDFAGQLDSNGKGVGHKFNPPINAMADQIDGLENWRQVIDVQSVFEDNISTTLTQPLGTTRMMRVHVMVQHQNPNTDETDYQTITELTWVVPE